MPRWTGCTTGREYKSVEVGRQREDSGETQPIGPLGWLLVAGWLVIPALQYIGAYIRTQIKLELAKGVRTELELHGIERLALLDLTPGYVVILVATLLYAYVRWRTSVGTGRHA